MSKHSAQSKRIKHSKLKKKTKIYNKIKKIFLTGLVFTFALLFLFGYFFYKKITTQLTSALGSNSEDILSESVETLVTVNVSDLNKDPPIAQKISMYLFDKDNSKIIIYEIPTQIEIDVPGRFGVEPLSNILALAEMDSLDMKESGTLFSSVITKLMAFPVDRYLIYDDNTQDLILSLLSGNLVSDGKNLNLDNIRNHIKTNLSLNEIFDLYKFSNSLPEDRIINRNINQNYLENQNALDEEFMDITFDLPISRENKSISILNGTDFEGVASYSARIVRNYGGRVIAVGNTSQQYEKSVMIVDDINSESTRILKKIFNIDEILMKNQVVNFQESEVDRSDVTVIFGLDYARVL